PSTGPARDAGKVAGLIAVVVAAILSLSYAVWAFTARRGIFSDFADGNPVSTNDAKSSDTIDTVLLVVAGLVVVIALVLWVILMTNRKTSGGAFDLGGLAASGVGVVVVLVGLLLASGISDGNGRAEQGDKGVTASLVVGGGFLLLAIGLLVGVFAVRGSREISRNGFSPRSSYQSW
ncbi:MAG: hypothetical protein ABJA81_10975, partial [Nocardioidaceae bacterium]